MSHRLEVEAPADRPIIVTRRWFAAPPEQVWACWTRPELLRRWMGPRYLETTLYEVDLRVGGGYRFVQRAPDGTEFAFHGTYRVIEPPHRLVSTFVFEAFPDHEAVDTLTLEARDGGTLATTVSEHGSFEARDGHLHSGMEEGMADGYARLDELLAEAPPGEARPTAPRPGLRLAPCLWFVDQVEAAAARYLEVFPDGRKIDEMRPAPGAPPISVTLELAGQRLVLLNGRRTPGFTDATSLLVSCPTQAEADRLYDALVDGGAHSRCGWLVDRFGVSWQIVPDGLHALLTDPDPGRAQRAVAAMLGMNRLDLAEMRRAADAG